LPDTFTVAPLRVKTESSKVRLINDPTILI
jgi:hypothetical protein